MARVATGMLLKTLFAFLIDIIHYSHLDCVYGAWTAFTSTTRSSSPSPLPGSTKNGVQVWRVEVLSSTSRFFVFYFITFFRSIFTERDTIQRSPHTTNAPGWQKRARDSDADASSHQSLVLGFFLPIHRICQKSLPPESGGSSLWHNVGGSSFLIGRGRPLPWYMAFEFGFFGMSVDQGGFIKNTKFIVGALFWYWARPFSLAPRLFLKK